MATRGREYPRDDKRGVPLVYDMEIKNLKKAAQRLAKAVKKNERIILFGDSDLDGSTSVLLLKESLQNLGAGEIIIYFPEWESEEYGLNKKALEHLKQYSPSLLVALDCGISNFKEIETASQYGFQTIIIDHHEVLDKLPKADIIVNPKQPGDNYPFKKLTTVCLVFLLAREMLGKKLSDGLKQSFFEIAALGAIADMMPEEDFNKVVVNQGLQTIKQTSRPGLALIIERAGLLSEPSAREIFKKLVAILNITPLENHLTKSFLLLSGDRGQQNSVLSDELILLAKKRDQDIFNIVQEVSQRVNENPGQMIFEGSDKWQRVLAGAASSRLCNRYKKPCFIFKKDIKQSRGSVRTPKGIDAVEALKTCADYLIMYGGHPPAAGFTAANENLDKLRECLEKYFG